MIFLFYDVEVLRNYMTNNINNVNHIVETTENQITGISTVGLLLNSEDRPVDRSII